MNNSDISSSVNCDFNTCKLSLTSININIIIIFVLPLSRRLRTRYIDLSSSIINVTSQRNYSISTVARGIGKSAILEKCLTVSQKLRN